MELVKDQICKLTRIEVRDKVNNYVLTPVWAQLYGQFYDQFHGPLAFRVLEQALSQLQ